MSYRRRDTVHLLTGIFHNAQRASCKCLLFSTGIILTVVSGIQSKLNGVLPCGKRFYLVVQIKGSDIVAVDSSGEARITSFASQSNAQTFDFQVSVVALRTGAAAVILLDRLVISVIYRLLLVCQ